LVEDPPGSRLTLRFNGRETWTTDAVEGTCMQVPSTRPTVTVTTGFPAVAEYASQEGKTSTVTLEILDFAN
jgi:hypothetical protein